MMQHELDWAQNVQIASLEGGMDTDRRNEAPNAQNLNVQTAALYGGMGHLDRRNEVHIGAL